MVGSCRPLMQLKRQIGDTRHMARSASGLSMITKPGPISPLELDTDYIHRLLPHRFRLMSMPHGHPSMLFAGVKWLAAKATFRGHFPSFPSAGRLIV